MKRSLFVLGFLALTGIYWSSTGVARSLESNSFAPNVDMKTGDIRVPEGYTLWPTLGTWSHASKKEEPPGAREYHTVYTQPETIKHYQKFGKYPDGAVLVKELLNTETMPMTTGSAVSHATTIKGWFVLVRDTQNRFSDSPLWGDGWGWSLFNADNSTQTVSKNYKEDCLACHLPARDMAPRETVDADKWIYSFGYPVLKNK